MCHSIVQYNIEKLVLADGIRAGEIVSTQRKIATAYRWIASDKTSLYVFSTTTVISKVSVAWNMQSVTIRDGIRYGFKIMAYYLGVVIVGSVISGIGSGIAATGVQTGIRQDPNVGTILIGGAIATVGLVVIFAGVFGALYKVIADSVAKGRVMSAGIN